MPSPDALLAGADSPQRLHVPCLGEGANGEGLFKRLIPGLGLLPDMREAVLSP